MDRLLTGSAELDRILGGGLPPGSLVVVAGSPGTGKTVLAQQICFANASPERPAVYYTTLSEPHDKLVRHLEPFRFFNRSLLGKGIDLHHLAVPSEKWASVEGVADEIVRQSFETLPSVVVLDSAKALRDAASDEQFRVSVYNLASRVAHTEAVLVLVGEYTADDLTHAPEFAVADVIVYMANEPAGAFDQRWLRVLKVRGSEYLAGQHPFRITDEGVVIYPRLESVVHAAALPGAGRLSTGVPGLDGMLGGGVPAGNVTLVAGPSGSGKTVLSLHWLVAGLEAGEPGLYVSFQETPAQLIAKARSFGWDLESALDSGLLRIMHVEPVEVGLDALAADVGAALSSGSPPRAVVESLTEMEHAARGSDRLPDFMWSFLGMFRAAGATTVVTTETRALFGGTLELARGLSFIVDNAILLRYVELESEIRRALAVVKMRDSDHVKSLVEFEIGKRGVEIKSKFAGVAGVITGTPVRSEERFKEFFERKR
jgi:circadian clock protein KaiC